MSRLSKDHQKRAGFIFLAVLFSLIPLFSAESASLVPCGGPGQTDCNICWFFVLARQVMDFLVFQAAAAFAAVCLALSGALFLMSGDNPGRYEAGKKIATSVFVGFWVMLAGWLFINTFFMVFGVSEWSGLKEGWWKVKATCASSEDDIVLSCGDGLVNGKEDCDPNEQTADCQGRTGGSKEHCDNIHERCDAVTCELAEKGDDNMDGDTIATLQCSEDKNKLGLGCYLDENGNGYIEKNECKKGKYVCIPSKKKLECVNVFGDPEYTKSIYQTDVYKPKDDYTGKNNFYLTDYCCAGRMEEFADGKIGEKPFTVVRPIHDDVHPLTAAYYYGSFQCDTVCKRVGKVCVGIGLTDPSKNACIYQINDMSGVSKDAEKCNNPGNWVIAAMELSGNTALSDCKNSYSAPFGGDKIRDFVSFDKYEYFCSVGIIKLGTINEVPDDSCGVCKPKAAPGEKCTGRDYKQDPSDSCAFHGNSPHETACYCY